MKSGKTDRSRSTGHSNIIAALRLELSQANLALNSYMTRCAALSKETDEARAKVELHQGTIESLQRTIGTLKDQLSASAAQNGHELRENAKLNGYIDRVREHDRVVVEMERARRGRESDAL